MILTKFKKFLSESIKPITTEYEMIGAQGGDGYTFDHEGVKYVVGFQGVSDTEVIYGFSPVTHFHGVVTGIIIDNKVDDIRGLLGKILYLTQEYLSSTNTKVFIIVTDDKKKNRLYKKFLKVLGYRYHEDKSQLTDQGLEMLHMVVSHQFDVESVDYLIIKR